MDRTLLARSLSGGYIEQYDFDMRRNLLSMQVDVLESGVLESYHLLFGQISHFAFDTESIGEGDRLELTELWIDTTPESSKSEEWSITISVWDMTHIKVRCSAITVNDETLR